MHFPPKNIELKPTNTRAMYSDPQKFLDRAAEYFRTQIQIGAPLSLAGLCLFLGFASRTTLTAYGNRAGFEAVVAWCRLVIEDYYENQLQTTRNASAYTFLLRTMGYDDQIARSGDADQGKQITTINYNVIPPKNDD